MFERNWSEYAMTVGELRVKLKNYSKDALVSWEDGSGRALGVTFDDIESCDHDITLIIGNQEGYFVSYDEYFDLRNCSNLEKFSGEDHEEIEDELEPVLVCPIVRERLRELFPG